MCGIFGVYGGNNALELCVKGLFGNQNRGEESAGVAYSDGHQLKVIKESGLVENLARRVAELAPHERRAHIAIGQVRYSTTGGTGMDNAQPIRTYHQHRHLATVFNGNLTNAQALRSEFEEGGNIFSTTTDTELFPYVMVNATGDSFEMMMSQGLERIIGAYSLMMMTRNRLVVAKGPEGIRPLCMGKLGNATLFSSESAPIEEIDGKYLREIDPGEILALSSSGIVTIARRPAETVRRCSFESVYFSRPDSFGFCSESQTHIDRFKLGKQCAVERPVEADYVVAVLDSGKSCAIGYSQGSGIPLGYGLFKKHYKGRTFINPDADNRAEKVRRKLGVIRDVVKGKRIVLVDDSIVRSTTMREIVRMMRGAGASEVHVRIPCPPVKFPCYHGIDTPTKSELVAANHPIAEIEKLVGADSLEYISLEGFKRQFEDGGKGHCFACLDGDYPTPIVDKDKDGIHDKVCL